MATSDTTLLESITDALHDFSAHDISSAGLHLFETLGYDTKRRQPLEPKTATQFIEDFVVGDASFDAEKALTDQWCTVDLLFQLTKEEIEPQIGMFRTTEVDRTIIETYLFFAIELSEPEHTRTALSEITRRINRLFPMPVMLLFKHGSKLSFAIIDRRLHKRNAQRDVLEKVTIIKDIYLLHPHRAHVEILHDLALPRITQGYQVRNFVDLHNAWKAILDVSQLNKRFYREIADWYFWAQRHVTFPTKNDIPETERTPINLIRLLARIIFIWFMRERGLIPDDLFREEQLNRLVDMDHPSSYYKAILQNLFFATLNQEMDHEKRRFRTPDGYPNEDYLDSGRYRYHSMFRDSDRALSLFRSIPFLNGGLFECLDTRVTNGDGSHTEIRIDGFSDREDNELSVPNSLFFADEQQVDLSGVLGEGGSFRNERIRGLIRTLERYKFTIAENTPVEEEIALDPELLGRVFENLLASFNPETETQARKQTGSFYTPREIVDYITDEVLAHHLADTVSANITDDLRSVLTYSTKEIELPSETTEQLISAIETVRILDPACGSGAFPMGVLNKLVLLLRHFDPHNESWKKRQLAAVERIDDADAQEKARKEIEDSFAYNELDYGRKLFLIKRAIYGVDIQPIAIHIAKLRFFISLLVDQKIDPNRPNCGIQALPNLESNFVAADTLRTPHLAGKQTEMRFDDETVINLENELRRIRERHFMARNRHRKEALRKEDLVIREKLRMYLKDNYHLNSETLKKVVEWDPYDQNATADWFDSALMFGLDKDHLFDVVIGNPPYRPLQEFTDAQKDAYKAEDYRTYAGQGDIYLLFYERGINLVNRGGYLTYISSNKWMRAAYGEDFRKLLSGELGTQAPKVRIHELNDFGDHQFFANATTYVVIMMLQRDAGDNAVPIKVNDLSRSYDTSISLRENLRQEHEFEPLFEPTSFVIARPAEKRLREKIEAAGKPLGQWNIRINYGIKTGRNEAFIIDGTKRRELIDADPKSEEIIVPIVRGKDIKRYHIDRKDLWLINSHNGVKARGIPPVNVKKDYPAVYQHLSKFRPQIEQRQDQGDHWSNLRNCAYLPDFFDAKIAWLEISPYPNFAMDMSSESVLLNTAYMLSGPDLNQILHLLNSSTTRYFMEMSSPVYNGKNYRFTDQYVAVIPIAESVLTFYESALELFPSIGRTENLSSAEEHVADAFSMVCFRLNDEEICMLCDRYNLDTSSILQTANRLRREVFNES